MHCFQRDLRMSQLSHKWINSGKIAIETRNTPMTLRILFSTVFYLRATDHRMINFDIFKPFVCSVWMSYILLFFTFTAFLNFLVKLDSKKEDLRNLSPFMLTFGAFCQQGMSNKVSLKSMRCVIICLFLTSMLMYYFYTSMLVSSLVEIRPETNIKNKDDLAKSSIPIGFLDSTLVRGFIKVAMSESLLFLCKFHHFRQPPNQNTLISCNAKFTQQDSPSNRSS